MEIQDIKKSHEISSKLKVANKRKKLSLLYLPNQANLFLPKLDKINKKYLKKKLSFDYYFSLFLNKFRVIFHKYFFNNSILKVREIFNDWYIMRINEYDDFLRTNLEFKSVIKVIRSDSIFKIIKT